MYVTRFIRISSGIFFLNQAHFKTDVIYLVEVPKLGETRGASLVPPSLDLRNSICFREKRPQINFFLNCFQT